MDETRRALVIVLPCYGALEIVGVIIIIIIITPGRGRFGGQTCSQKMQLQIAAATWRIQSMSSNSAFYQITLVFVCCTIVLCECAGRREVVHAESSVGS